MAAKEANTITTYEEKGMAVRNAYVLKHVISNLLNETYYRHVSHYNSHRQHHHYYHHHHYRSYNNCPHYKRMQNHVLLQKSN